MALRTSKRGQMRSRVAAAAVLAVVLPAGAAFASSRPPIVAARSVSGLPDDGPAALYRAAPRLPTPHGWPGPNAFPRTSGTGRLDHGGFFWTDYLYDDHGATGASIGGPAVTAGSPSFGTYTYPPGAAHNNGADIFAAAVLKGGDATYWRVDWTTLADPRVPLAEWVFDRDNRAMTGMAVWPAGARVRSPGIDTALVVSSRGARVLDARTGRLLAALPVAVDRAAKSFVVRVPDRVLHPTATWRVRLASGLADAAGTAFATPPNALAGQPAVYNVTFRSRGQEPPADNFWNDEAQTRALDTGDVSAFSAVVRWADLVHGRTTSEPRPTGWSDRWYVSSVDLGSGVLTDPSSMADGRPNYLGRVQPYAVFVPPSYDGRRPAPLTFLLHSLTQNHNQYAATTPRFAQQACQARGSICVTTLGRGPDGMYHDEAELDFWEVWREVAAAYRLDPDRTVVCGYSMGGIGTNQLAMQHPDLFARAVSLAGGVGDVPAVENLRWVPTYLAGGAEDELVWASTQKAEADALDALGYRFRWLLYPALDHVAYELADSFGDAAAYMGDARRQLDPAHVTFRWTPRDEATANGSRLAQGGISWTQRPDLGVGTTGAYWVRELRARSTEADARVDALTGMRLAEIPRAVRGRALDPSVGPEPAVVTTLDWRPGRRLPRSTRIVLRLTNVSSLRLLLADAGFGPGTHAVLDVTTDGRVTVRLGARTLNLSAGHHLVPFTA